MLALFYSYAIALVPLDGVPGVRGGRVAGDAAILGKQTLFDCSDQPSAADSRRR
jgi:hypothetical protein